MSGYGGTRRWVALLMSENKSPMAPIAIRMSPTMCRLTPGTEYEIAQ